MVRRCVLNIVRSRSGSAESNRGGGIGGAWRSSQRVRYLRGEEGSKKRRGGVLVSAAPRPHAPARGVGGGTWRRRVNGRTQG